MLRPYLTEDLAIRPWSATACAHLSRRRSPVRVRLGALLLIDVHSGPLCASEAALSGQECPPHVRSDPGDCRYVRRNRAARRIPASAKVATIGLVARQSCRCQQPAAPPGRRRRSPASGAAEGAGDTPAGPRFPRGAELCKLGLFGANVWRPRPLQQSKFSPGRAQGPLTRRRMSSTAAPCIAGPASACRLRSRSGSARRRSSVGSWLRRYPIGGADRQALIKQFRTAPSSVTAQRRFFARSNGDVACSIRWLVRLARPAETAPTC